MDLLKFVSVNNLDQLKIIKEGPFGLTPGNRSDAMDSNVPYKSVLTPEDQKLMEVVRTGSQERVLVFSAKLQELLYIEHCTEDEGKWESGHLYGYNVRRIPLTRPVPSDPSSSSIIQKKLHEETKQQPARESTSEMAKWTTINFFLGLAFAIVCLFGWQYLMNSPPDTTKDVVLDNIEKEYKVIYNKLENIPSVSAFTTEIEDKLKLGKSLNTLITETIDTKIGDATKQTGIYQTISKLLANQTPTSTTITLDKDLLQTLIDNTRDDTITTLVEKLSNTIVPDKKTIAPGGDDNGQKISLYSLLTSIRNGEFIITAPPAEVALSKEWEKKFTSLESRIDNNFGFIASVFDPENTMKQIKITPYQGNREVGYRLNNEQAKSYDFYLIPPKPLPPKL